MSELVEKLRATQPFIEDVDEYRETIALINPDGPEAADTIESLVLQIKDAREALDDVRRSLLECKGDYARHDGLCIIDAYLDRLNSTVMPG